MRPLDRWIGYLWGSAAIFAGVAHLIPDASGPFTSRVWYATFRLHMQCDGSESTGLNPSHDMANALAYQIQHRISPNRRIFVVRPSDAPVVSLADVTYRLYPRRIYWVQQLPIRVKDAPPADEPCTIDWPSAEDVFTLTCPDFSWSYPDSGAAHP